MAQFVKQFKPISLSKCVDSKWDLTSSMYLAELTRNTESGVIRWTRDHGVSGDTQYRYFGIYKNANGLRVILEVSDTLSEGIELLCSYNNHGKSVRKLFDEWSYPDELQDLYNEIQSKRGDNKIGPSTEYQNKAKTYDNISKLTNPYYNKSVNDNHSSKKILNTRGKKAIKLLENVEWQHNWQILGE